ncbi:MULTISPECIES: SRPBCC family protein [Methylophaga]|uniref:MxaD protein n=1 Tax=Methylophaga muralis TaxID=291169 RepID=A0A1E3GR08_9GAMM|nr:MULTISPECIES: SRPBCC family protein [Methylophaga]MCL5975880.1 SRPBCC family protein [Gammaproteobacteria bacterium]ODN66457.1 mxaD protein [Methylophaga muralis]THK41418.1 SRPBCC family protein [Methylophaga sp. SB9B]
MKKFLQIVAASVIALPLVATAHGPTRQQVEEKVVINAAPEKVWEMLKDFSAIDQWHPAVESVEMEADNVRVLTLKSEGNPTITEELEKVDDERMSLIYKITGMSVVKTITFNSKDTPYYTLPVSTYKSWMFVKEVDGGTEVMWRAKFYRSFMDNPPVPEGQADADAVAAVTEVYKAGLENLKNIMEK